MDLFGGVSCFDFSVYGFLQNDEPLSLFDEKHDNATNLVCEQKHADFQNIFVKCMFTDVGVLFLICASAFIPIPLFSVFSSLAHVVKDYESAKTQNCMW